MSLLQRGLGADWSAPVRCMTRAREDRRSPGSLGARLPILNFQFGHQDTDAAVAEFLVRGLMWSSGFLYISERIIVTVDIILRTSFWPCRFSTSRNRDGFGPTTEQSRRRRPLSVRLRGADDSRGKTAERAGVLNGPYRVRRAAGCSDAYDRICGRNAAAFRSARRLRVVFA